MGKEHFTIARIFGAYYELYSPTYGYVRAILKGKFRLENRGEKHPFVVGDGVLAEKIPPGLDFVIEERLPRKNQFQRKSDRADAQVLGANLDQVAVLASLKDPETKEGFLDRALVAVGAAGIPALVVFTKKDLVPKEETEAKLQFYRDLGITALAVSLQDVESLQALESHFRGRTSFLCGNSGVGKSSLLNLFGEGIPQRVNQISTTTGKGKHTTTNSFALFLDPNTALIDSPGVKEWGILHLQPEEILDSFPEMQKQRRSCTRKDCCDEGDHCPKVQLLESGLPPARQKSLESMLESLEKPHRTTRRDHWSQAVTDRRERR